MYEYSYSLSLSVFDFSCCSGIIGLPSGASAPAAARRLAEVSTSDAGTTSTTSLLHAFRDQPSEAYYPESTDSQISPDRAGAGQPRVSQAPVAAPFSEDAEDPDSARLPDLEPDLS